VTDRRIAAADERMIRKLMIEQSADYLLLNHTADLGFEIKGFDQANLFEKAGRALLHVIFGTVLARGAESIYITLSGDDQSDLMVRWLTEILYLIEGEHLVTTDIVIDSISSTTISATLSALPFDPLRHEIIREIKAVTYHQIEVAESNGIWKARVIFDL
jgi:SHS2 domain-containing protein